MSGNGFIDFGWDGPGDDFYLDAELLAENNERERKLWGDLLPAKRVLQRRGFGVWWHNKRKRLIRVDHQTLTVNEFKKMAALHKRVSGIDG